MDFDTSPNYTVMSKVRSCSGSYTWSFFESAIDSFAESSCVRGRQHLGCHLTLATGLTHECGPHYTVVVTMV